MNKKKLKDVEKSFLRLYPGGFTDPHFADMEKKHKMRKMTEFAELSFAKSKFKNTNEIIDNYVKLVSRSSMVSMFEKPKFRDFANSLIAKDSKQLASGLQDFLHGNQEKGFDLVLDILKKGKLAKWSLITAAPAYYHPETEVFIKPTTAKGVISFFELKNLVYKPQPSWGFYEEYRKQINIMKGKVNKKLSPNNAAFSGFLMMSLPGG